MKVKKVNKVAAEKVAVKKCCKRAAKASACNAAAKTVETVFTVHAEKGKDVFLAGEFNSWDPTAKKMSYKAKGGIYTCTVKLAPGEYQYKFVIDGTWCADPENINAVPNDHGTFNSVITVK